MRKITHVEIDGTRYKVFGFKYSNDRGNEFVLEDENGMIARTCHAVPDGAGILSARTGGEVIQYLKL